MAITFAGMSTHTSTNASTGLSYAHTCALNTTLLVLRVNLRGTSATPANVSVTVNGVAAALMANSAAVNTSNRSYNAFFTTPTPPAGTLLIAVNWNNAANLISSALDVLGALPTPDNAWTATGNSANASLNVICSEGGAVLDSVSANNDRTFIPSVINPQYSTLQTSTGNSDVSHRAGSLQNNGSFTIGWSISSSSNYAYSAIALAPSTTQSPSGIGFMFLFG